MRWIQFNFLLLALLAIFVFLQHRLWFESGGVIQMFQLKKQLSELQSQNEFLKKRNQTLLVQVQGLQKNQDAVESRARQELGMIKKDEKFYQVVK